MSTFFTNTARRIGLSLVLAVVPFAGLVSRAAAQTIPSPIKFEVTGPAERMTLTVNTSKILEFPFEVPKMLVNNPEMVRVVPLSPKSVQVSAIKSGVTQLNVWDADDKITSVDLIIIGDVRELEMILKTEFPDATLRLRPLNNSLYISGFVPRASDVAQVSTIASDYFPKVINNMSVGGVQKILLHVKAMEVSRTKLRALGFDWAAITEDGFLSQSVSGLLAASEPGDIIPGGTGTNNFLIQSGDTQFFGFLEALRKDDLVKLLAEPTLTTISGRSARFNVGGEVPVPVPQSQGVTTIEYKEFGTSVDFVPIVLGNGNIRLEVRASVSEVDPSVSTFIAGGSVPGFRRRYADTGVEMKTGQTLAIAGLVYNKVETATRGTPWLMDVPWVGAAFRRNAEKVNEVELVLLVTPEFAEAMDATEVPPCGPGQSTTSPTDIELFFRGYREVPKDCKDGNCLPGHPGYMGHGGKEVEVPLTPPAPTSARRTISDQPGSSRAGTRALPASTNSHSLSKPQNRTSGSATGTTNRTPSGGLQPALIGPLGYDDLR
ncbi:MAG TPA: pilus assembly protein N-terminal domain-containing protein [Pirellulaceae bacterium]|nr:pilus assembly protein N-terminal domain-containing protein [Pirellulaceae bacterium]